MSELGPDIEHYPELDAELAQKYPKTEYATSVDELTELVFVASPVYEVTAKELRIGNPFEDCTHNTEVIASANNISSTKDHIRKTEWNMRAVASRAFEYLDTHPRIRNNGPRKIANRERYLASLDPEQDASEHTMALRALTGLRAEWESYQKLVGFVEQAATMAEETRDSAVEAARRMITIHQYLHDRGGPRPDCIRKSDEQS